MLHALAFIIWDVGTRVPAKLLADFQHACASVRAFVRALWQFALGLVVLFAGATLMLSLTIVDVRTEFSVLEGIAVVAGLAIEMLIGPSLR
ncbi:MAG: hypothetical protein ACREMT_09835, partial [Vulcanimicrobiaceae bacterium]